MNQSPEILYFHKRISVYKPLEEADGNSVEDFRWLD
jgi:hypothetical protein